MRTVTIAASSTLRLELRTLYSWIERRPLLLSSTFSEFSRFVSLKFPFTFVYRGKALTRDTETLARYPQNVNLPVFDYLMPGNWTAYVETFIFLCRQIIILAFHRIQLCSLSDFFLSDWLDQCDNTLSRDTNMK